MIKKLEFRIYHLAVLISKAALSFNRRSHEDLKDLKKACDLLEHAYALLK